MCDNHQLTNFHAGMFQCALYGLIGRETSSQFLIGYNGYYQWIWYPKDDEDAKKLEDHSYTIAKWIDNFTGIIFSSTRIGYGFIPTLPDKKGLFVFVSHKIKEENKSC